MEKRRQEKGVRWSTLEVSLVRSIEFAPSLGLTEGGAWCVLATTRQHPCRHTKMWVSV